MLPKTISVAIKKNIQEISCFGPEAERILGRLFSFTRSPSLEIPQKSNKKLVAYQIQQGIEIWMPRAAVP